MFSFLFDQLGMQYTAPPQQYESAKLKQKKKKKKNGGGVAAGHCLPFLRLGSTAALTGLAVGALAAAGTGAPCLRLRRRVAERPRPGRTASACLVIALGAALARIGPVAYMFVVPPRPLQLPGIARPDHAVDLGGRPPHDVGGALCAAAVFAAGMQADHGPGGARESPGD